MQLNHAFTVPASVDETWAAFNDIATVAECFPGAAVTSVEGEEFKGTAKVKLGPIALTYAGQGRFLEKDDDARRFVLEAKGKDKRGNGTAGATVTASFRSATAASTEVEVLTDLTVTGKPAQFGRGMMQDVSDKLLTQFIACLESRVAIPEPAVGGEPAAAAGAPTAEETSPVASQGKHIGEPREGHERPDDVSAAVSGGARRAPSGPQAAAAPTPRPAASEQAGSDALDLGSTVLPVLMKHYWRQIAGAVLVLWVLRRLLRGRRQRRSAR